MKALIITNHSFMLWRFRLHLLSALCKRGEVVVLTPDNGKLDELKAVGCRVIVTEVDRRGLNPLTDLKLLRRYRSLIKEEKPTFVLTFSIKPNLYGGFACRSLGIPYFTHVQGLGSAFESKLLAPFVTLLYRRAAKGARAVFFENQGDRDALVARRVVTPDKTRVLAGAGIDLDAFPYHPYPKTTPITFLFLGRLMKEKGVEELFYAAERIKARYGERVAFSAAGFFEEAYAERVKDLASRGILTFLGFREDVLSLYQAAHAVILPSYHEGMSNVLLEGGAVGRPLITTDVPGCREAVVDGESGYLVPVADAEALYAAIEKLLLLPDDAREKMGLSGRAHIANIFDKRRVVADTIGYLWEGLGLPCDDTPTEAAPSLSEDLPENNAASASDGKGGEV